MKVFNLIVVVFLFCICFTSCREESPELKQVLRKVDSLETKLAIAYKPSWGDIMRNNIQVFHSYIWFAAKEQNWELAEHMVEELSQGFEELKTWHPYDQNTAAIDMINQPLQDLSDAILQKDSTVFKKRYLTLTNMCNTCHSSTGNDIYNIQIPTKPIFTSLRFEKSLN